MYAHFAYMYRIILGDIIDTCISFKNTRELYFFGSYFVQEEYCNRNVGYEIYDAVIKNTEDKNVTTNAVLSVAEKFVKSGDFPLIDEDFKTLVNYIPHRPFRGSM
ncbi:hypothetical protein NPIL_46541 [Nephila pilipes]|uniref:Uncharacterized protein n=1 Tax=Nephila pilipes TaxID=299642 RepID=A0A8X6QUP7_NEPPI|nr:hypothetical protein NPIL_46541 [Nephila pilipes]